MSIKSITKLATPLYINLKKNRAEILRRFKEYEANIPKPEPTKEHLAGLEMLRWMKNKKPGEQRLGTTRYILPPETIEKMLDSIDTANAEVERNNPGHYPR